MKTYRKILIVLLMVICAISCAFAVACTTEEPPENKPQRLNAPKNLAIAINDEYEYEAYVLTWDSVENASEYKVLIDDQEFTVTECSFDLEFLTEPDTYNIYVCAIGDGTNYTNSIHAKITHTVKEVVVNIEYEPNRTNDSIYAVKRVDPKTRGKVIIPSTYRGGYVRQIDPKAFEDCIYVTEVVISEGIGAILSGAFNNCSSLKKVSIPSSIEVMYSNVFDNTAIYNDESNWHNGVLYVDNCLIVAKKDISGAYSIKEGTRMIAQNAFSECSALTEVTIPDSISIITSAAFYKCTALSKVNLPNNLQKIETNAFGYCSSLTKIDLSNSVISIGGYAFV